MRLVEVVVLMGAHCVSPVEHSQMMTEAGKVQCAVVVEKDTDAGTIRVTPPSAAGDPKVVAAIAHFGTPGGTRIVPAFAPAGSPPTEIKMPADAAIAASGKPAAAVVTEPAATQPQATDADAADVAAADQPAEQPAAAAGDAGDAGSADAQASTPAIRKVVKLPDGASKPRPDKPAAAAKPAPRQQVASADPPPKQFGQCKGNAVAKWYKSADGHRKYRCVRPVPTSDGPVQIY